MIHSPEQVRVAAYHRWQRRGGAHGLDWNDWFAAEQELLFARHYEVQVSYRLDEATPRFLGDAADPVCRFCERASPRTTFTGAVPVLPETLGNTSLLTFEECDECRDLFREAVAEDLDAFAREFQTAPARRTRSDRRPRVPAAVPIAAYKGLVRAAVAILPRRELASCEDAIEWISNPDHDLDAGALGVLSCAVTWTPPSPPWAALARRVDDDAPMPYLLFYVGTGGAVFQVQVPFCARDEDLDGRERVVPQVAAPPGLGREAPEGRRMVLPVAGEGRRRAAFEEAVPTRRALHCGGVR
jgi:Protein of unknown function (DUF2934)